MVANIDERGSRLRMRGGSILLTAGILLLLAPSQGEIHLLGIPLALIGGFMIFEARNKWCVLRACGINTPW